MSKKVLGFSLAVLISSVAAVVMAQQEGKRYWMGVGVGPVPEMLRVHLGIAADEGLLVERIVPDSPADKAGLERHDVLLGANSQQLNSIQDLVKAVNDSQGESFTLELIHAGQKTSVEITSEERPLDVELGGPQEEQLQGFGTPFRRGGPFQLRFFGPGFQMPMEDLKVPGNVQIQVEKHGEEPAKIKIQRGDETWELTEKELDQLPEDLRPLVDRYTGGASPQWKGFDKGIDFGRWFSNDEELQGQLVPQFGRPADIDKRLREMNQRMERMFRELQGIRGGTLESDAEQVEEDVEEDEPTRI